MVPSIRTLNHTLAVVLPLIIPVSVVAQPSGIDLAPYQEVRYVSITTGSDFMGDGTLSKPWKSLTYALDQISDANSSKVYGLLIASGTYTGEGITAFTAEPYVHMYGCFDATTWIRGSASGPTVLDGEKVRCVLNMASHCVLDGFVITRGYGSTGGGVYASLAHDGVISNCTITSNTATYYGGGVLLYSKPNTNITNCIISNNHCYEDGGGVYATSGANTNLTNCLIYGNSSNNHGAGIYCNAASPDFHNCTIADNDGGGVTCEGISIPRFCNCILWNPGPELSGGTPQVVFSCIHGGWPGNGNILHPPRFGNPLRGLYTLLDGSPCIDSASPSLAPSSDLLGNLRRDGDGLVDMGAIESPHPYSPGSLVSLPYRYYVASNISVDGEGLTWETAFPTASRVLSVIYQKGYRPNLEIWVKEGKYQGNLVLEPNITLCGGFSGTENAVVQRDLVHHSTIFEPTKAGLPVIRSFDGNQINGFTISGGVGDMIGGGGLCFDNVSSATISSCTIMLNQAPQGSGGVIRSRRSNLLLSSCLISSNTASISGGGVNCDQSSSIVVSGCTIVGNAAGSGAGLSGVSIRNSIVEDCLFLNNSAEGGSAGMACSILQSFTMNRCTFHHNTAKAGGAGALSLSGGIVSSLTDSVFTENTSIAGGALVLGGIPRAEVRNCTFENNVATIDNGGALYCDQTKLILTNCSVSHCSAKDGGGGISCDRLAPQITDCEISNNSGLQGGGIYLRDCNSTNLAGSRIAGNSSELNGGGVYLENSKALLIRNCDISSNFSKESGGGLSAQSSTSAELVDCSVTANLSLLDGGGLFVESTPLKLLRCRLADNWSRVIGGGCYISTQSAVSLTDCDFLGNNSETGGGLSCGGSKSTITGCRFEGNGATKSGGGLLCSSQLSLTLSDCILSRNAAGAYGGGLSCSTSKVPDLNRCRFIMNSAEAGGGAYFDTESAPKITNCEVSANQAFRGGGFYTTGLSSITNCTIAGNESRTGAGLYVGGSSPAMTNCIIWNRGEDICGTSTGLPNISYSCIQGGWRGTENTHRYPGFADPENGDYHLLNNSPCIDSASALLAPSGDMEGRPRPGSDGLADMGAYESPDEFVRGPGETPVSRFYVSAQAVPQGDGLSWESAFQSINEALEGFYRVGYELGAEIWASAGNYPEVLALEPSCKLYGGFGVGDESLSLRNRNALQTVVDASGTNQCALIAAERTLVDGITLTGGKQGGAYYGAISSATLSFCTISENDSWDSGGGVRCDSSAPLISDCTITANSTESSGGGIASYASYPTIRRCLIRDNVAEDSGGGVSGRQGGVVVLDKCTLCGNVGAWYGGGIYCLDTSVMVDSSTISSNTAPQYDGGGAYFAGTGTKAIRDCIIELNAAKSNGGGFAVSLGGDMECEHCSVTGNRATLDGGGIWVGGGRICEVSKCVLTENSSGRQGGGIFFSGVNASSRMRNCSITECQSNMGGGVSFQSSSPLLLNCVFAWNTSTSYGGSLYLSKSSGAKMTNCTVWGNSSGAGGGAFYYLDKSSPTMANCILWDNLPQEAQGVTGTPKLSYCDIEGGWEGIENISADPLLVDPVNGNYHLQPMSPCINKGIGPTANSTVPTLDFDGDPRSGTTCDIGADEYHAPTWIKDWVNY